MQMARVLTLLLMPGVSLAQLTYPTASATPWWRATQVMSSFAVPPGLEDLVTVVGWGDIAELPELESFVRRRVARQHFYSRKAVGVISIFNATFETLRQRPELMQAVILDIDGKPLTFPLESTAEKPAWWCNTNHAVWRAFLLEQAKRLVDAGVDGILLDEVEGTLASLAYGGSFGEPDMTLFRQYLAARYSPQVLRDKFGITDLASFNYGEYIRSRGLLPTWKSDRWSLPLWKDFYQFQVFANLSFIQQLVRQVREYAKKRVGREIAITANVFGLYPNQIDFCPLLDYFTVEYPFLENGYPPWERAIADYKLARALGDRPAYTLLSAATAADLTRRPATRELMKIYVSESYAARGALITPHRIFGWDTARGQVFYSADSQALRPFYSFFARHSPLLDERFSLAETVLLYSQASHTFRWSGYRESYRGTALALLHAQEPFDVLVMGQGASVPEWPTDVGMERYRTALLPYAACVSASQLERLLAWVSRGGTLIVFGETATCDLTGEAVRPPDLSQWLAPGTRSYGLGRIVRLAEDLGARYREERAAGIRERLTSLLATPTPVATTPQPAELVVLVEGTLGGKALLVHLLNGNYNNTGDRVVETGSFTLRVRLPPALNAEGTLQVYLLSPERPYAELLPATRAAEWLTVACAFTHVYDLVVVTTPSLARQLAEPVLDEVRRRMREAEQAGINLDPIAGLRSQLEVATGAANYFRVTDLAHELLAKLKNLRRPRILFDETHDQRNTLSSHRASLIVPGHPEWALMSRIVSELSDEFVFEPNETSSLTPELLSGYDVLLLAAPRRPLSVLEREAVAGFVRGGGGLVVLGDCGLNRILNPITQPYGITLLEGCVLEANGPHLGNLFTESISSHPAVLKVPTLALNWGGALAVTEPGVAVLAKTSGAVWRDLNGNRRNDPDEPYGPFVLAAAAEAGSGRVVVISDNCFHDDGYEWWGNDVFLRAVLRWVARPAGGRPVLPVLFSAATMKPSPLAPEMLASAFGSGFAESPVAASDPGLPIQLGGVTVKIVDSVEREGYANLFFVSPSQVNWLVPGWVANGRALVTITNQRGVAWSLTAEIVDAAPGLFSANGTGTGPPAGQLVRVRGGGAVIEPLAVRDASGGIRSAPIVFGPDDEDLYLKLYATGLGRNPSPEKTEVFVGETRVQVVYCGREGSALGLDRIHAGPLPRTLAGQGETTVRIAVSGRETNRLLLTFH